VAWQRGQKRATRRTGVAHFGHFVMACGAGAKGSLAEPPGFPKEALLILKFYREGNGSSGELVRAASWALTLPFRTGGFFSSN